MGIKDIFRLFKTGVCPVGVDITENTLNLVQLGVNSDGVYLAAAGSRNKPEDIRYGSGDWQQWCIEIIKLLTEDGRFHGRDVITAMPASEVFIDHIKVNRTNDDKMQELAFEKVKHNLPFEAEDTVIKCLPAEEGNTIVIATERNKIDRYLAIYEKANLNVKSIGAWPIALANMYVKFFGRRKADLDAVVMLLDIGQRCANVVICRHSNLLFARSIPVGAKQLEVNEMLSRLMLELSGCRQQFGSMYENARIERLLFLSGQSLDTKVYTTIAKQMELPAQTGDCLTAVEILNPSDLGIDNKGTAITNVGAPEFGGPVGKVKKIHCIPLST